MIWLWNCWHHQVESALYLGFDETAICLWFHGFCAHSSTWKNKLWFSNKIKDYSKDTHIFHFIFSSLSKLSNPIHCKNARQSSNNIYMDFVGTNIILLVNKLKLRLQNCSGTFGTMVDGWWYTPLAVILPDILLYTGNIK